MRPSKAELGGHGEADGIEATKQNSGEELLRDRISGAGHGDEDPANGGQQTDGAEAAVESAP